MTIAQRLMILIGASIAGLALLTGVNLHFMDRAYTAANFANVNVVPSLLLLEEAGVELGHIRVRTYRHALNTDAGAMAELEDKIREARNKLEKSLKDYEALLVDSEDRRLLDADRAGLAEYLKASEHILEVSRANRKDEVRELLTRYAVTAERINAALVAHMEYNKLIGARSAEDGVAAKTLAGWVGVGIFVASAIGLGALGLVIMRSLTVRLNVANRIADQIAEGDLRRDTALVQTSADEVGRLLQSLEKMRGDLARTIGEVVTGADDVVESAAQLSTSAQQVSASTDSQSRSTSSAAAAVEEMTVSIDQVGGSAEDANRRATEAGEMALGSGRRVEAALAQINQVASRVEHTAGQMQTLSDQVQQIGRITVVIREVADQTNLLALNAAIEAARAGEQGRGFAVVADEVRKLAERTTNSVQEISSVIQSIQTGAVAAVDSMASSREVVAQVVATAGEAGESMLGVRSATETVQQAIATISDALREQRATSTDLARNVESIAGMSEENSAAVASVAETANRLAGVSDVLKGCVSRFRL